MSPRKTRRGAKSDDTNETFSESTSMKSKENTPPPSQRTLRTRNFSKTISQDSEADQSLDKLPKNDTPSKSTRSKKKKVLMENLTNDLSIVLIDTAGTKKPIRRTKNVEVSLEQSTLLDSSAINNSQIENSRKRRKRGTKEGDKNADEKVARGRKKYAKNIIESSRVDSTIEATSEEDAEVQQTVENAVLENLALAQASPRTVARKRGRNDKSKLLDFTPESSPITVHLSPHRTTKTPRKSPMNLGSPKSHAEQPLRLSKTPRKLPVVEESPAASEKSTSSFIGTPRSPPKTENKKEKRKHSPKKNSPATKVGNKNGFERRFSKSPKIVLKTPRSKSKSKSPRVLSSKVKKPLKVSPSLTKSSFSSPETANAKNETSKRDTSPKKSATSVNPAQPADSGESLSKSNSPSRVKSPKSPTNASLSKAAAENVDKKLVMVVLDKCSTPVSVPERRTSSTRRSNAIEENVLKVTPVNDGNKERRTSQGESPRRSKSSGKKQTPVADSKNLLRDNTDSALSKSLVISSSASTQNTKEKTNRSGSIISSTPRERIRRNLSTRLVSTPKPKSPSKLVNNSPRRDIRKSESSMLEDITNPLISEDDESFSPNGTSRLDGTFEIAKKSLNVEEEEEEEEEKPADGTYELAEPKTPVLRRKAGKRSIAEIDTSIEERSPKRTCRVRFASPPLHTPEKQAKRRDVTRSRSATPGQRLSERRTPGSTTIVGGNQQIFGSVTNASVTKTPTSSVRRRSNSMSILNAVSASKAAQNASVNRLSKPRLIVCTAEKKPDSKTPVAKKAPNFAQIHQRKFAKMESLVDAKKRVEKRHLTMNNQIPTNLSKVNNGARSKAKTSPKTSSPHLNGAYTRFGFKLRQKEAVQIVSNKTAIESKNVRSEKREMLKGVRTNRRFDLIMKARKLN